MLSRTLALASADLTLRTRFGRLVEIIFHVVGGDAESVGGEGGGTKERNETIANGEWKTICS